MLTEITARMRKPDHRVSGAPSGGTSHARYSLRRTSWEGDDWESLRRRTNHPTNTIARGLAPSSIFWPRMQRGTCADSGVPLGRRPHSEAFVAGVVTRKRLAVASGAAEAYVVGALSFHAHTSPSPFTKATNPAGPSPRWALPPFFTAKRPLAVKNGGIAT